MAQSPAAPPPPDPSLALCEVLEAEYAAITGDQPDPPPPWQFTPEQILEPEQLADRLTTGQDDAARSLRAHELENLVKELNASSGRRDRATLRRTLADGLNAILSLTTLYDPAAPERFGGVKFRSQTVDLIGDGPVDQRNRLILEDTFPELQKLYDLRLARIYKKIHAKKLAALCLSGGGIRSATFALGVVQGLARSRLLDKFHFLSTVSGGGYLGGWLSAWMKHTDPAHVAEELRRSTGRPLDPEPAPIRHLRTYSNYLSPKLGLLSADTWTLAATYLRNLFLNWLILIPALVGVLLLPLLLVNVVRWQPSQGIWLGIPAGPEILLALIAFVGGVLTVRYVHANRPVAIGATEGTGLVDPKRDQRQFLRQCLYPLVIATAAATISWRWGAHYVEPLPGPLQFALFGGLGAVVHGIGWALSIRRGTSAGAIVKEGLFVLLVGAVAGIVAWQGVRALSMALEPSPLRTELYVCLAVPFLLSLILIFTHLYVGYTSDKQLDAEREWSARFSAWTLIVVVGWLVGLSVVILGSIGLGWVFDDLTTNRGKGVTLAVKTVVGAVGVFSGAVTLRKGGGAATPGAAGSAGAPMGWTLGLALTTFVAFLVVLLSWTGVQLLLAVEGVPGQAVPTSIPANALLAGGLLLFAMGTASRVDSNKFSLHAMYRARLIRAYLGASRPAGERDPNRFTGFDDGDNLPMRDLWTPGEGKRPLHVVNLALNLVAGSNLAWQQRKAESFTVSPLHCGAHDLGYRRTWNEPLKKGYAGMRGVSLGTAITISGAAASPNMGYHSSPIIAFLLTLFNIRLGWWLGNPGHAGRKVYQQSESPSTLRLLSDEALGHTDDRNSYVYLSDGGHFENLGLYEMVLRRCHTIVVSDAGYDPHCGFEDLGNAIRKIRVDLGIPIEFREVPIYPRAGRGPAPSGKYCAIGTIHYSQVDPDAANGTLIYLKPAFYGGEPRDIFNYASTTPAFPHETTADQFFSEAQFESYRALGSFVIEQVVGDSPVVMEPSLDALVGRIKDAGPRPVP